MCGANMEINRILELIHLTALIQRSGLEILAPPAETDDRVPRLSQCYVEV